ncbi:unnamed protein product [Amaranthus hypochondriacus]
MGRRQRPKPKSEFSDDEAIPKINNSNFFHFSGSDDEEANEDLSLKIVEKAMTRNSFATNLNDAYNEDFVTTEFVASEIVKKEKKKKKKTKAKNAETEISMVMPTKEEEKKNEANDVEVINLMEPNAVDNSNSDNTVLRNLLRGPRYFDPPDKSWGACFNCGEEGHTIVNCTSARRKKPCFICGSLEHEVKHCQKGRDCFICKVAGHRAKDCPKKFKLGSTASEFCLKCGASAHAMFSCNSDYSPDDLKEIQCYVCKRFGHLCCVDYYEDLPSQTSCYKCGLSGHNGQECRGSHGQTSAAGTPASCYKCGEEGHFARECTMSSKECNGSHRATSAAGTPSSCYKCGEEGHFARECIISSKSKRTRDLSTPIRKHSKDTKSIKGYKSAPQNFGKTHKKIIQFENDSPNWSSRSKRRSNLNPDDFSDYSHSNGFNTPVTQNKKHKIYGLAAGGQGSSSRSSMRRSNFSSFTSNSQGYSNDRKRRNYDNRFSASRFGKLSSDGLKRNYDHW